MPSRRVSTAGRCHGSGCRGVVTASHPGSTGSAGSSDMRRVTTTQSGGQDKREDRERERADSGCYGEMEPVYATVRKRTSPNKMKQGGSQVRPQVPLNITPGEEVGFRPVLPSYRGRQLVYQVIVLLVLAFPGLEIERDW